MKSQMQRRGSRSGKFVLPNIIWSHKTFSEILLLLPSFIGGSSNGQNWFQY
jgi:hypothetical protein